MVIKVSEQVNVEENMGRVQNGNINEGIQCYQNTAILIYITVQNMVLYWWQWQRLQRQSMQPAITLLFGEYSNNFIEVHNVNQPFNALEMHHRNRNTRTL